jgi:hypothetical protein
MSEIRLNLIDSEVTLAGTIHGSIGDACVAALSAEPETINELQHALERFHKDLPQFQSIFQPQFEPDTRPYDAGILIIDLASRIVACESTYSQPGPTGEVHYHNGREGTTTPIFYVVPDDWLFLRSIEDYAYSNPRRRKQRLSNPPIDTRAILFGRPLLEFLAINVRQTLACREAATEECCNKQVAEGLTPIAEIHAQWLLTPREDLRGQSPRDVLLSKQDFINADLESRSWQWSLLLEGPPCLSRDSFAYRFGGYGTHEWVLYYDLVRGLLDRTMSSTAAAALDFESLVDHMESLKDEWLNQPNPDFENRIPAIVIDNERRRLPEAMGGRSMVVDEDCPCCKMLGDECEAGREVCFWHLDGSNMEEHFAFSQFLTETEYLEEMVKRELRDKEFEQKWREREERIARGEAPEPDPFFDPPGLDEYIPFELADAEPPEA